MLAFALEAGEPRAGVVVLAHGGSERWNELVRETVTQAALTYPVEVAFGMGFHAHEVHEAQAAMDRLQAQGVSDVVVIPLLVSSHSDVYRQYEYLFGMRRDSPWPDAAVQPLTVTAPVRFGAPLDGHPYVAEILLERAQALSTDPTTEVVVLVAHGPTEEPDDVAWLHLMRQVAEALKAQGQFADVAARTLRDDASWRVRRRATHALRRLIREQSATHRVLVVPLLMARGGIEHKIPQRLHGLQYVYSGDTLLPHPQMARWIHESVERLLQQPHPPSLSRAVGDAAQEMTR